MPSRVSIGEEMVYCAFTSEYRGGDSILHLIGEEMAYCAFTSEETAYTVPSRVSIREETRCFGQWF